MNAGTAYRGQEHGANPGSQGFPYWLVALLLWGAAASPPAQSAEPGRLAPIQNAEAEYLRPAAACPQDLPVLITGLLRDLPSYADLVAYRSLSNLAETEWPFGSVLLVSEPDFEPINLADRTFQPPPEAESAAGESAPGPAAVPQQVFFTTLERQYVNDESILLQNYHWLFLAPSAQGWQMAFMYSSIGPYPANGQPPSPPQYSTDGIIGQAVGLWLRDCRARSVYPVRPDSPEPPTGL